MTTSTVPSREDRSTPLEDHFTQLIATEISCQDRQVRAADALFGAGATVPFVARYRKEATGGLIDEQLEKLFARREYFLELMERRDSILESIRSQDKLTDELERSIRSALTKQGLEDLYLPYKKKKRTRAQIARERGLEPLAEELLQPDDGRDVAELAGAFVSDEKGVADSQAALAGARDILAERLAETATHRAQLREALADEGVLVSQLAAAVDKGAKEAAIYRDYFDYREPLRKIASHRLLATIRGEKAGILSVNVEFDDEREIARLSQSWQQPLKTPRGEQLAEATSDGYRRLLRPSITSEVRTELRDRAESEAISVFRANLEALLLQAPLGEFAVMGLDPGYRTGCKLAVVDATGRAIATDVIYPIEPNAKAEQAKSKVLELVRKHDVRAVAIGNGTGSRETERFAREAVKEANLDGVIVAIVPETGASIYSASPLARSELPDLDVSLRGAVSIARRLQDPLAELVKIEPKALGVGQYQHDVNQKALSRELDTAVAKVVNQVGVELNTASRALLKHVSGLSDGLAEKIVAHRDSRGPFDNRAQVLEVSGFGPKTFELAGGFLRIRGGSNRLDATAVHPERYDVVAAMTRQLDVSADELVGNPQLVSQLDLSKFTDVDAGVGEYTLEDIRSELEKPGRDPRPEFRIPEWRDDVVSVDDLKSGMVIEGRVSNVTNFGAFIDIGVKRDGLVHVSELTHQWVDDPRKVVKVGDVVKTKILEVDLERGRISLSLKALEPAPTGGGQRRGRPGSKTADKDSGRGARKRSKQQRRPLTSAQQPKSQGKEPERQTTIEDLLEKWGKKHS